MGRFPSPMPTRPRVGRARRRVFFCAESLESRQLLSVAAFHPTIAPTGNVPAAVGPVVPSPVVNVGTPAAATGLAPVLQIVIEINPVATGQASNHGFTETIFIFEETLSSGIGAASPTTPAGNSTSPGGTTSSATSTNPGEASSTSSSAITPLTSTILAGPAAGNRAAIAVVVVPQTPVANFAPSTIPVTTQAILATATLEEQPIQPPVLGQGFESGQTQGIDPRSENAFTAPKVPVRIEPQIPAIDFIEPYRPALDQPPAAQPAQPAKTPTTPAPARNAEPVEALPVEPAALTDPGKSPEFPILSPRTDDRTEAETPSMSMAAMVGTAAIASGGYHLVLGGSNRFNQRWIPTRGSSKTNRGRRSEEN
jgi:hypothetical protein